jgi:hypothetical protein
VGDGIELVRGEERDFANFIKQIWTSTKICPEISPDL